MQSKQYRVWDVEQEKFLEQWVFLGTDGLLYDCGIDDGPFLLQPDWFRQERVIQGGKFYLWSGIKVNTYIIDHQHEWYTIEFATGYPDKNGTMIFDGDILRDEEISPETPGAYLPVTWGYFDDCCVEGETWILGENVWQPTIYAHHEDMIVAGTIHTTSELLEKKEEGNK